MIEPWAAPWSKVVYDRLHHEPFEPEAPSWETSKQRSSFRRQWRTAVDRFCQRPGLRFEQEFSCWQIERINPIMPFRYLISGGVSLRSLTPSWSFKLWKRIANALAAQQATGYVCADSHCGVWSDPYKNCS